MTAPIRIYQTDSETGKVRSFPLMAVLNASIATFLA